MKVEKKEDLKENEITAQPNEGRNKERKNGTLQERNKERVKGKTTKECRRKESTTGNIHNEPNNE